ncbi:hypothetical protein Sango_3090300 [Sesamum angolense]|uniref:Reverse transcriptase domain-containing protein n=1 Tax=Sesamum angolense TaxID=2727404 RepID=A0AAE1W0E8_9LAMI|nr:hypothetical protein Sango_3090300 [Sesamum angolense]
MHRQDNFLVLLLTDLLVLAYRDRGQELLPVLVSPRFNTHHSKNTWLEGYTGRKLKDAFFDIAEDKAPGPDGYSSGFYKAAWPVIVREIIKAILEFFNNRSTVETGAAMRCALKVDLRKAYEHGRWDFLSAVLQLFGFPGTFIGWVEECVTTPMFSVCINGNPHGFFKGSRGMRDSPSIGGARSLDYSNLALQMTSSSSVKRMWLRFGYLDTGWPSSPNCPGYMLIHKRVSYFSPVQLMMSGNNYLQHYISRRVTFPSGWESIQLSFAGRLQLIKSVLMSTNVYWAMAFILPKGVIRERRRSRNPGYPCPQQSTYESPPLECDPEQPVVHWVKWIAHTRLRHKSVWAVDVKGSWGWRKILRLRSALLPYIEFKIGDGESFSLWHDPWHSLGSLITRFPRGPSRTSIPEAAKTLRATLFFGEVAVFYKGVYIFRNHGPKVGWHSLLGLVDPSTRLCCGWLILDKLSTMDKPWLSHIGGVVCCAVGRWRHMSTSSFGATILGSVSEY